MSGFSNINVSDGVKIYISGKNVQENRKRKELWHRKRLRYVADASAFCGGRNIFSQHVTCERISTSVETDV